MNATDLFGPQKKARVEIIPLIDVVFFLLATFVLFTLSLDKIAAITTNLPVGRPDKTDNGDSTVYLQATSEGMVFWKLGEKGTSELISTAEIPARLAAYKQRVAVPRVFVRGDNQARFGTAVAVFDLVRQAGIGQVSIERCPAAPERDPSRRAAPVLFPRVSPRPR